MNAKKIVIFSGEGERGTFEEYKGKRTESALKARLTKERCKGQRFAYAYYYSHETLEGYHAYEGMRNGVWEQRTINPSLIK